MFVLLTNVMRAKVHKILQTETFFGGRYVEKISGRIGADA